MTGRLLLSETINKRALPEDGHLAARPEQLVLQVVELLVGQDGRLVEVEGLRWGTAKDIAPQPRRLGAAVQRARLPRLCVPHPQGVQELLLLLADGFPCLWSTSLQAQDRLDRRLQVLHGTSSTEVCAEVEHQPCYFLLLYHCIIPADRPRAAEVCSDTPTKLSRLQ